jgi:ATP-dependent RNA helicase SUPV3L1/SUV3
VVNVNLRRRKSAKTRADRPCLRDELLEQGGTVGNKTQCPPFVSYFNGLAHLSRIDPVFYLPPPVHSARKEEMSRFARSPLTAVLGPTNTGKTHLAVERMMGHSSGMMGFPLRLLAREVYDRVLAMRGPGSAALVTGEERIWPETARYIFCTAEAMPLSASAEDGAAADGARDVAFVALDEAQLGADRERGHVFTSRMLHARGREETMILGSSSLAPIIRGLLPDAEIVSRPRFSTLRYDGPRKLSRLPPRTAIVAFSAEEVYSIAEALRRFSGGAAVVMGSLSPRTRNAQVAMYQAGEVDYIVATDAIGMGLNLDIRHAAFAGLTKFDGIRHRRLTIAEMAQIAGRAGRHQRDGTFGSIGANTAFEPEEIANIEEHRFPRLDWVHWRNPDPSMDSVAALIAGLEVPPPDILLRSAPEGTDLAVLKRMEGDADAMAMASGPQAVRRLWSACSLPDFTNAGPEAHGRLVARLWRDLGTGNGYVDADWVAGQIGALDIVEGPIETLADRIARVRTWCYIAQRPDWLADAASLSQAARDVETRLSDALHAALTARFVDRRTTVLLRSLGQDAASLPVAVAEDGVVTVDREAIGRLDGFTFSVDPLARAADRRMLLAAAEKHLAVELAARATALATALPRHLTIELVAGQAPALHWRPEQPPQVKTTVGPSIRIATLVRGKHFLAPRIALEKPVAALDSHIVEAVTARLKLYVDGIVGHHLDKLSAVAARARDPNAAPSVRAVLAALVDAGGSVPRASVKSSIDAMGEPQRLELRQLGVRVGTLDLFMPDLIKPAPLALIAALDGAWRAVPVAPVPVPGTVLVPATDDVPPVAVNFRRVGNHWLRVDMVERVAQHVHKARVAPPPPSDPSPMATEEDGTSPPTPARPDAPSRAFHIDPELPRSMALPLDDRLALYKLLGFTLCGAVPAEITVAEEPGLWWRWGNPSARQPRRPRMEGDGTPRKLSDIRWTDAPVETAITAGPERPRNADRAINAGAALADLGRRASTSSSSGTKPAQAQRNDASHSPNNPFAGLADLLGGKPET